MLTRSLRSAITFVSLVFVPMALAVALTWAPPAFADAPETQARALEKKAMEEDYLATDFDKAQDKLQKALTLCKTACASNVKALLHRDLGVVQIGGGLGRDKGIKNFVEALKLDPGIQLDPDVKTKELESAFAEAKKKAGPAPAGGGDTGTGTGGTPAAGGEPAGDFDHTPAPEQAVRTPVPIYVEYKGSETLVKVVARYKGFGMSEWKPLELKKSGNGWGVTVPCTDVQQGNFLYYLQGFNAQNDPVAIAGDRNHPYTVAIKPTISGAAPSLPGQPPPTQCPDSGDCPPGFPCAKANANASSSSSTESATTEEPSGKGADEECEDDSECASKSCVSNKCTAPKAKHPRFYLGVGFSLDFTFLGSGADVCKIAKNGAPSGAYYCTDAAGRDYPPDDKGVTNASLATGNAGKVESGGATLGSFRIFVSGDYAATGNILVGARLGVAVNNQFPGSLGPSGVHPLHAELRFTYLFGEKALTAPIAPYIVAGAGVADVDGEIDVQVKEGTKTKMVQAWQTAGPVFLGVGGGLRVGLSKTVGLLLTPLRINYAFGGAGGALWLAPEAGIQFGL